MICVGNRKNGHACRKTAVAGEFCAVCQRREAGRRSGEARRAKAAEQRRTATEASSDDFQREKWNRTLTTYAGVVEGDLRRGNLADSEVEAGLLSDARAVAADLARGRAARLFDRAAALFGKLERLVSLGSRRYHERTKSVVPTLRAPVAAASSAPAAVPTSPPVDSEGDAIARAWRNLGRRTGAGWGAR